MRGAVAQEPDARPSRRRKFIFIAAQAVFLYAFWLGLSGRTRPLELILGVFAVALVVTMTSHVAESHHPEGAALPGTHPERIRPLRLLLYFPWLLIQIVKANVEVAYLVLHPGRLNPVLVEFRTTLHSEASQVLLAHSITLTPGTITIDVHDGRYLVHAITPESAESLFQGHMQQRIQRIFDLDPEPPTEFMITRDLNEVDV